MYQLIVFDIDGTMLDSKYSTVKGLQNIALKETGKLYSLEELDFSFGDDAEVDMKYVGLDKSYIDAWGQEMKALADTVKPFDGILDTLKALKEKGYCLAIASSRPRNEFGFAVEPHGLLPFFDYTIAGNEVAHTKPSPEPLLKVMEWANIKPENTLFIGDTIYDCKSAEHAGVDFALAGWGAKEEMKTKCETVLHTPSDILLVASK